MAHGFLVDEARRLIEVRYTGEVDIADRVAIARRVLAATARSDVRSVLLDFRQAHSLSGEPDASRDFVDQYAPTLVERKVRFAYVLQHEHQLNPEVERLMAERGVVSRRFADYDEAVAWLGEADPADTPAAGSEPGSDWTTWID